MARIILTKNGQIGLINLIKCLKVENLTLYQVENQLAKMGVSVNKKTWNGVPEISRGDAKRFVSTTSSKYAESVCRQIDAATDIRENRHTEKTDIRENTNLRGGQDAKENVNESENVKMKRNLGTSDVDIAALWGLKVKTIK
jgi:hypothetical protein